MNINFFEKKKVNILPYLAGGLFLVFLLLIGLYFFFLRMNIENTIEEKNAWIAANIEEVSQSQQINQLDQYTNQSLSAQETLVQNRYPMDTLTEDLASLIPNEPERVASFQIAEANQVTLILENITAIEGQSIVEDLEERPYVTQVQLLNAESQNTDDDQLRFELIINLNVEALTEEDIQ